MPAFETYIVVSMIQIPVSANQILDRQMDGRMEKQTDRWIDKQMDGRTDPWTDGRMDGQMDRQTVFQRTSETPGLSFPPPAFDFVPLDALCGFTEF